MTAAHVAQYAKVELSREVGRLASKYSKQKIEVGVGQSFHFSNIDILIFFLQEYDVLRRYDRANLSILIAVK
jgi:hypothetical protein